MKIGIIGTGSIVESFITAGSKIPGVSFSAIFSRNINSERVKYLLERYKIKYAYGTLSETLENSDINFIYVASPNSLHYEQSLMALKAGKNVICEKPFTPTRTEAENLFNTAKNNKLMLFEGICTIHLPNYKKIKEYIRNIGTLRIVQLNYSQYSSRYNQFLAGDTPNVFNPKFSGGSLQDINIYNVHFMTGLFGMPERCLYFPNLHENGIDTSGIMIMQYAGFTASLVGSKDTKGENFVYIQGEKGYIHAVNGSNSCQQIILHMNDKETETINVQEDDERLRYEIEVFKDIYDRKDFDSCYKLCEHSINVVGLVEKSRTN